MKRSIDVIEHAGEIMKKVNDDHQLGRYGH